MNILLIEDNETLGSFLTDILTLKNYTVEWHKDGVDVELYFLSNDYDLVLVDWMLPSTTGIEVIQNIRNAHINVPIIMLTAKSETADKVEGLTTGADDYLTKPFELDELEARMLALIKRYQSIEQNRQTKGNVTFDLNKRVFLIAEQDLELTHKEYLLLELLFLNHTVSREMILNKVWSSDQFMGDNNIDALVKLLKKKLQRFDTKLEIKTMRNVGYKLDVIE